MDFKNRNPFARSAYFYVTISRNFERFQYFNFEADFLKKKKTFLVEKTKIQNTSISYKTTIQCA